MEISYLKEFVILSETCNFLEAADILYSTQSTLSKHIRSMELELGVPLFDRTTRKVSLSKFGSLLLPYARQILELQGRSATVLQDSIETDRGILNVGSIPALAEYKITDVLVYFKKSHPHSTVNVIQGGATEMKELLRKRKIELAFIRYTEDMDDDLVKIPYTIDTMVAVLPFTHPLAKEKSIPLQALADEDFVLSERQSMLYNLSLSACKKSGFEPKVNYTDSKHENIIDFVIKGLAVALMMKQLALYVSSPKIAIVDISPSVSTQINLCHLKGVEISPAAKHFLLCAEAEKETLDN